MDIAHNADYLPRAGLGPLRSHGLADPDALPDRVFVRPEHPGHCLIDDHNGRAASVIRLGERTATQERDAQGLEKLRTDSPKIGIKHRLG